MATKTKKATAKKTAKKTTAKKTAPAKPTPLQQLQARYPHIASVAQTNDMGRPLRVVIECTFGGEECESKREIATQDAFQVQRCRPCQREYTRRNRRKPPVQL